MRRILAPVIASVLVLAGCGGGGGTAEEASGPTVETKFGAVEVPADPQRVVALGWGDAETALALGVQPVGASDWVEFGGRASAPGPRTSTTKHRRSSRRWNPTTRPSPPWNPTSSSIRTAPERRSATTASRDRSDRQVPEGGDNYLTTMDQQVDLVSQALGKSDEGESCSTTSTRPTPMRAKLIRSSGQVRDRGSETSEGWGAYVEESGRVQVMEQLGFKQSRRSPE